MTIVDNSDELTLQLVQDKVDHWIQTIGVKYFSELTNLAQLTEEVGELSRLISRIYGEQSFKKNQAPENPKNALADEMADILFVLICLANQTGVNLTEAFKKNLDKKTNRDHSRHLDNPKLRSEPSA